MSKKDKKIEIQIADSKVVVGKETFDGYQLTIGKKAIAEIADMGAQFALVKNADRRQSLNPGKSIESAIENYNLNK
ncbi:MAG: DUF2969 family protein [Streptococcus sp.]